ncbi:tetratricopeptide repeat-containing sensor histidine kinase [Mucilaginibacter sabulilitoris]|uniref:histidine kinase n=1 Tax=Mucilaginibacter sabulilitoris TaxID=1173583 RepID=A0ABZ0TRL0_9SPHI|nr:tetratricopeptide repeat-containing sensor histidine kinase [Mucilaginibacter sabulilitoris]WPU95406.1 tetratricopeptide repeat-containing sensor histidine kinase [Mucilaginibacter sabulilitoris]
MRKNTTPIVLFSYVFKKNVCPLRNSVIIIFCLICTVIARAQTPIDSINALIKKAKTDTGRINRLIDKTAALVEINLDSAAESGSTAVFEAVTAKYLKGEANARRLMATILSFKGDYASAQKNLTLGIKIYKELKDESGVAKMYSGYGMMYGMQSKYDSSIVFYKKTIRIANKIQDNLLLNKAYQNIGISYQMQSNYRESLVYFQKALGFFESINDINSQSYIWLNMGLTYNNMDDNARAEQSLKTAIRLAKKSGIKNVELYAYSNLAATYSKQKKFDKSYLYAMNAVVIGRETGDLGITAASLSKAVMALADQGKLPEALKLGKKSVGVADSSNQPYSRYQVYASIGSVLKRQESYDDAIVYFKKAFNAIRSANIVDEATGQSYYELSECYEKVGLYRNAYKNFKRSSEIIDSIRSTKNIRKATEQNMTYEYEKKQQAQLIQKQKQDAMMRIWLVIFIAILIIFAIIIIGYRRAFRNKQKANALLKDQKQEIESTLTALKTTQKQLIQSEKMASLGQLTAGIAHEIQNPLNFVNNFSEVSAELTTELKEEIKNGNTEDALAIADDLKENLSKIQHHGKRADNIVKGMLEHSRTSTGERQPININSLAEDFFKLSYHGMRVKDKSFNAEMITNFTDQAIVMGVQQDISRVMLNLFNNAFYSVNQKRKVAGENYKPTVTVSTEHNGRSILLKIKDNGNGISPSIKDKILQPFFTTKPTGEGTGLGLSLSYDIIVNGHNGSFDIDTQEFEYAEFIVSLPKA